MLILNIIKLVYFLFILIKVTKTHERNEISIGFIIEETQSDLLQQIPLIIKNLEPQQNLKFIDSYITYERENLNTTMKNFCNIISEPLSIIIDLTYSQWEQGIDLLKLSKIPYIRVDITLNPFFEAFENFVKKRDGYDAAIIMQNDKDFEEAIYYIITKYSDLRWALYNGMEKNFVNKLKNVRPTPSYFGIFANTANMNNLVKKANETKLFKQSDKWHLIFLDTKTETFNSNHYLNFYEFIPIKELTCETVNSINSNCVVGKDFTFVMAALHEVLINIENVLKQTNYKKKCLDCSVIMNLTVPDVDNKLIELSNKYSDSNFLKISDDIISYKINLSINLISMETVSVASWYNNNLFNVKKDDIKPSKRFYRIGTTEAIPWSYIKRDAESLETILDEEGNPQWEGYCIDFIQTLSERLDFDYEIITPNKGTFGERQPDGNWDGLIGDLITGQTDIALAALKMTSEREEVIDFVAPYFEQTGITIVIRNAVRETSLFKFMTVLRLEVWLSIVAALVSTAVLLWLLDRYSPYSAINNKEAYPYPCREFTLKESFWFALTSFTPQGGGETPKAVSGRVLVGAYWLFVVLMLATFTANLAAFLTVERMQTPVSSLEQLGRQSRINYTVVEGSETHEYFINMKFAEDTLYRMWKELTLNASADQRKYRIWDYPIKEQYGSLLLAINASNPVKDAEEGFRKVNEHESADFAFIHDSAEIKYAITKNCNLTEVGEVFAIQPYAIAIQQGSNLQDELSYAMLELQRDRYFEDLNGKYWNKTALKLCSGNSEDNEGITLESLGGVFIATLFGLGLALITLIGEVIYYKRKKKLSFKSVSKIEPRKTYKKNNLHALTLDKINFNNEKAIENEINFGTDEFRPTRLRRPKVSFISVNPRNALNDPPTYYE